MTEENKPEEHGPANGAAKPAAAPKKKNLLDEVFQYGFLTIIGVFLVGGLLIVAWEVLVQIVSKNPAYHVNFASISGGLQVLDRNAIPNFLVTSNIQLFADAFGRMSSWTKDVALSIIILLTILLVHKYIAVRDNMRGALAGKAPDIGATVALLISMVIWIIGTPVLAAAVMIACLPLMVREKTSKTPWWQAPVFAGALAIIILTVGNSYLAWPTVSWMGYARWVYHMLVSLGTTNGIWLIEAIKLGFTGYLFAKPNRDGSGLADFWLTNAWMSVFLEKIPFSSMGGPFWTANWSPTFFYVWYNVVFALIIVIREIARPGKTHSGKADEAKKASPISIANTTYHVFAYTVETFAWYGGISWFTKWHMPPLVAILIGILVVALHEGFPVFLAQSNPGGGGKAKIDFAVYFENIGDYVPAGPLTLWASDIELVTVVLFVVILGMPDAINWLTTPVASILHVMQTVSLSIPTLSSWVSLI